MAEPMGFESFFEHQRSKLFGAICLITGNRQEAEEITQDAFLRLWEQWDRVAEMEDPTGFLFKTAMNVFRNRARRASIAARRSLGIADRGDDLAAVEDRNPIRLSSSGTVPVAILSTPLFNSLSIVRNSATFGRTGDEPSLVKCKSNYPDVNGDGRSDLVCHFVIALMGFVPGDASGTLRALLPNGVHIEGTDVVRVLL